MHQELGQPTEALPLLRRSLERSAPTDSIVRKLYALIAHCHRQLGQQAEALSVCREGRRGYPEDVELLFHEANVLHMQGDLPAAETCLLRLLEHIVLTTAVENDVFDVIGAKHRPLQELPVAVVDVEVTVVVVGGVGTIGWIDHDGARPRTRAPPNAVEDGKFKDVLAGKVLRHKNVAPGGQ